MAPLLMPFGGNFTILIGLHFTMEKGALSFYVLKGNLEILGAKSFSFYFHSFILESCTRGCGRPSNSKVRSQGFEVLDQSAELTSFHQKSNNGI